MFKKIFVSNRGEIALRIVLIEAHPEWLQYSNKSLPQPQHQAVAITAAIA